MTGVKDQGDRPSVGSPADGIESGRGATDAVPSGTLIEHFKTRDVVELLGLSRRQLQYWAKTGLIEPSARTRGGHHRYSFDDLVALKATKRLIDAGVSVQQIRKSVSALQALLPQVGRPLTDLVLVATGDVVLVFREDTVFEAISGQEWVFEVAAFEREVAQYRKRSRGDAVGVTNGSRRNPGAGIEPKQEAREEKQHQDESRPSVRPVTPVPRTTRRNGADWSQTA